MATKKPKDSVESIEILEVQEGRIQFCIVGRTPIILSRMSQKAQQELLMPKGRKSAAEKAANLKHNPFQEYRDAPYTWTDDRTYLCGLATWFKQAIRGAAIDIPGSSKAQIGRLLWVQGERVPLWGAPKLFMAITRSADMNKTPDVRTRCMVPEWATTIEVSYTKPLMKEQIVVNLLAASGLIQGVGDWRPQKGSGTYGQFRLASVDDPEFVRITQIGRAEQLAAMEEPEPYDEESAELLSWFEVESKRRGFALVDGGKQ